MYDFINAMCLAGINCALRYTDLNHGIYYLAEINLQVSFNRLMMSVIIAMVGIELGV